MSKKDAYIHIAERLSFMLSAGIPLSQCFSVIESQIHSASLKKMLQFVARDIEKGSSLAESLSRNNSGFGSFAISMIRVGEASGNLKENLAFVATELRKKRILMKKIQAAFVYPICVTVAAVAISVLMLVSIFPKILPIFKSVSVTLPLSTQVLIIVSDAVAHYWFLFALVLVAIIAGFIAALRKSECARKILESILFRIPLVSLLLRTAAVGNMCRTTALLYSSGVSLPAALVEAGQTVSYLRYRNALIAASQYVAKGGKLSAYITTEKRLFDPMVAHMIAIGETTGGLSDMLVYASEHYERDLDSLTKNLTNLIEPMLMVIMGLGVGFIAVAVISPIYAITQNVHR